MAWSTAAGSWQPHSLLLLAVPAFAQENPLENPTTTAPAPTAPKDDRPVVKNGDVPTKATSSPGSAIRVDVNLVLVPVTVTDPMNRLVTGLERENFQIYRQQQPADDQELRDAKMLRSPSASCST